MGKRETMYMSDFKHSHNPSISDRQDAFFIIITREPSDRTTSLELTRHQARIAPKAVKTMKPTYVPSVTVEMDVTWMFCASGI